jgi:replication fork protection complex subunit Tof1/Swi1
MDKLRSLLELEERDKSRHTKANGTRHSRFGTTIAVRAVSYDALGRPNSQPTQNLVLHSQSAITADTGKLLDEVKKTRKPPTKLVVS